jgi:NIPSNAP
MIYEFHRHEIRRDVDGYHGAWKDALRLMHRHGIEPVGFFLTEIGDGPTMNYLLPFEDFADKEKRMAAYMGDPEKRLGFAADGLPYTYPDYTELWTPTSYSDLQ